MSDVAPVTTATPAPTDTAPAAQPAAAQSLAPALAAAPEAAAPAPVADPVANPGTAPTDGGDTQQQQSQSKAPESYQFTAPEGYALDEKLTGEFSALAKEMDLTQEQAQKLIDLDAKRTQESNAAIKAEREGWVQALHADKEFGGEKLMENVAIARKAMDTFGSPELKEWLNTTQLGNHPELVRAFYRAGLQISQDNHFISGGSGNQPVKKDAASALYPNQKTA